MAGVTRAVTFLLGALPWLLPQQAAALPQTLAVFPTAFLDAGAPSTFSSLSSTLLSDRPINGTIFWLARFFGSCSDGAAAAVTGCSLNPNNFAPALVKFSIDGLQLGTIGSAITFPGAGPNNFDFGPVTGSFDCDLVNGCDLVDIVLSFNGSGGSDTYNNFGILLSLRNTPFQVPVPASVLLLTAGFGALAFARRRKK